MPASPYDDRRPIVSVGGIGSHHLVALALHLQAQGRELHAVGVRPGPDGAHARRISALLLSTGPSCGRCRRGRRCRWRGWRTARGPGRSRPGCTCRRADQARLALGFVEAGLELAQQVKEGVLPAPPALYITGGTCGSCCGLALGLALAGLPVRIRVVSALEAPVPRDIFAGGAR